jgi:transcriptional regulator with XRE-family HTH domain
MSNTIKINPQRVKALRTKRGLSQKQLAAKVGLRDPGTVSRWERGEIDRVRSDVFGRLCSAFDATETEICGEGPFPESGTAQQPAAKGQMNLSIDTACRNTLTLVADRYGVTRQQIVEIAPLVFFVAAEENLQARRERLDELRGEADTVRDALITEATSRFRAGKFDALRDEIVAILGEAEVAETWLDEEKTSIEQRDLFGSVYDRGYPPEGYEFLSCLENNHFADALTNALKAVLPESKQVEWEPRDWGYGRPNYRICAEEAGALVGGDQEAVERILSGAVALYEMPSEIRKASPAERAKWVLSESRLLAAEPEDERPFIPAEAIEIDLGL